MNFEVDKYFLLSRHAGRANPGVYLVDAVLLNHFPNWPSGGTSPTSCTWIKAHNIETGASCEFAMRSVVHSYCLPWHRDYNLKLLGI